MFYFNRLFLIFFLDSFSSLQIFLNNYSFLFNLDFFSINCYKTKNLILTLILIFFFFLDFCPIYNLFFLIIIHIFLSLDLKIIFFAIITITIFFTYNFFWSYLFFIYNVFLVIYFLHFLGLISIF